MQQQQMQFQQAIMQREVEMQIKGLKAQMKEHSEAMMKFLKEMKKEDKKKKK
jgi:hypothetical protein